MSVSNPNSDIINQSSVTSSGTYAPSGYVPAADGAGNVEWVPLTSATGVSSIMDLSASAIHTPITSILSTNGLGNYWINQHVTRWGAIASMSLAAGDYQAASWWDQDNYLVIATRKLPRGNWTQYVMNGSGGRPSISVTPDDAHKDANLGIDKNGYIHIDYGHSSGGSSLNYRISDAPINTWTGVLGNVIEMLGNNAETKAIYPVFVNDNDGKLYFFFISEYQGYNGELFGYVYDETNLTWAAMAGTSSGQIAAPYLDGRAIYYGRPYFDADNVLHLMYSWQWDDSDSNGRYNLSYVKWSGSWLKSDGTTQTIPIRPGNGEVVDAVVKDTYLMTAGTVAVDNNGHPHLTYNKQGGDGYSHIYDAHFSGSSWTISQVTISANGPVSDGTYPYSLSMPDIVIDPDDGRAYIFYEDKTAGDGWWVAISTDYSTWVRYRIYTSPIVTNGPRNDVWQWRKHQTFYSLMENWTGTTYPIPPGGPFNIRLIEWTPSDLAVFNATSWSWLHTDDADGDTTALHHTLGSGANQAAAGNHAHSAPALALNDLTDVDTTGEAAGDVIYYNGSAWQVYSLGIGIKIALVSGKLIIGNYGGGNYLSIDATTGNLRLAGNATQWDDLRIPADVAKPGATAPAYKAFGPSGNLQELMFEAGHDDEVYFDIQMPHAWKEGSKLYPHVHWTPTTADAGNVVWFLEYSWCNVNGTFGAPSTMSSDATAAGGTAWVHKLTRLKDGGGNAYIDGTGMTLSSMLVCRLHRNSNSGSDTLNKDVAFLEFDLHFEIDSFGSDEELIKDSSASFLMEDGSYLLLEDGTSRLLME